MTGAPRVSKGVPTGGQFAASARSESGVALLDPPPASGSADQSVSWSIEPGAAALDDVGRAAQVAQMTAALDRLLADPAAKDGHGWASDGGGFQCDGGAMAAALVATRLGIPNRPVVGLYWHSDPEVRADLMGEYREDESDEEWQANLDSIAADCMDEHHHWVVLWPGTDHAAVWDPNAEIRNEPHLQNEAGTGATYAEIASGPWRTVAFDPDADPFDEAHQAYPGLVEAVSRAVGTHETPTSGTLTGMDSRIARVDQEIYDTQEERTLRVVRITPAGAAGRSAADGPVVHAKIVGEDGSLSDYTADIWDGSMSNPSSRYAVPE